MKKFLLNVISMSALITISALSLSSCLLTSCEINNVVPEFKDFELYSLTVADEQAKEMDELHVNKANLAFINNDYYIPYLSIGEYAKMYSNLYKHGYKNTIQRTFSGFDWGVADSSNRYVFVANFIPGSNSIKVSGSLNGIFTTSIEYSTTGLNYQTTVNGSYIHQPETNYQTFNYSKTSIRSFKYNGEYYYPLGLYETVFNDSLSSHIYFNYKALYEYRDQEMLSQPLLKQEKEKSVFDEMSEVINGAKMPTQLAKYNRDLLYMYFDETYGLKRYKKINNMYDYFNNLKVSDNLLSADGQERGYSYKNLLASFDDNHTGIIYGGSTAWDEYSKTNYGGENCVNRSKLTRELKTLRDEHLEEVNKEITEVEYSESGETAMFTFDSFSFADEKYFYSNKDTKEISPDAYEYDTYLLFKKRLSEIENKGGVKNVVLDISTNGGGVIGVMWKLLATISPNNYFEAYNYSQITNSVIKYEGSVDINGNDIFEENETYGSKFKFYILGSDSSYSSANAFAFLAQKLKYATIIGSKTGGGECSVNQLLLPNGQRLCSSSTTHLGFYDSYLDEFIGDEDGAKSEIDIPKEFYYNIEYIEDAIK